MAVRGSMHKTLTVLMVVCFYNAAFADEIKLYKSGTALTFNEDMHCMNNDTALSVIGKVQMCTASTKIKLDGLMAQHKLEMDALKKKLGLTEKMYTDIISEKDNTIDKIQLETLQQISSYQATWWKYGIAVAVGIIVGSGIAVGAIYLTE